MLPIIAAGRFAIPAEVYTPTYGPESRGGKARCWVTLSDKPIDAPVADVVDFLMVLNKPSMDFIPQLRSGGMLLYNILQTVLRHLKIP